ncbi:MAG TPA: hypothetical protein VLU38_06410 [Methanomassiliicoccales archaeon]|nr:hypothetical protein [Methanomassiliicoccales archaeon]
MPNCWNCGQTLQRPDSQYCDHCGARIYGRVGENTTHAERTRFDENLALLFNITGIGAIAIGVLLAIGLLRLVNELPGMGAFLGAVIIGALVVGAVFLFMANRIKEGK